MSRRLLLLFALAFMAMLIVVLPLRLALDLAGAEQLGLSARSASGSLWNGRLEEARLHGIELGNASARLSPLSLLVGTRAVRLSAPQLDARLQLGRRRGLDHLHGQLALPPAALLPGLRLGVQADALQVLFLDDACDAAGGRVTVAVDQADGSPLLTLDGTAACEGRAAVLALAASAGDGPLARMQATARIHSDGQWTLDARVPVVDDPASRLALEAAGFHPGPGGWSRVERGSLQSVGSQR